MKLEAELLVMMMNFEGRRVGMRVSTASCWRSEKVRRRGRTWYGMRKGSKETPASVTEAEWAAALSLGMKRVALSGKAEESAEESKLAHPPKSPAPISASMMFLSWFS